jgi:Arc/MetJ-type ribon-helix-helix transcriptional regulator
MSEEFTFGRIAYRYADRMAQQLVTRVSDDLAAALDQLVADGVVASRSEAVRLGLEALIDRHRRRAIGEAIVAGYRRKPQTSDELGWADEATARMIADEPW